MNKQLPYYLALLRISGFGPVRLKQWIQRYKDFTLLFKDPRSVLQEQDCIPRNLEALKKVDWRGVERDLKWSHQMNAHIITFLDPMYPKLLKEISASPPLLFVQGDLKCLSSAQIAIVGSRQASCNGQTTAYEFAQSLSKEHFMITSGLALGVDSFAHRGALVANGRTIAVLANGLDQIYPRTHQALAEQVIANGCLVSEFPTGVVPMPRFFPRRNRLISGLSLGTLVVEAGIKSGSLITARFALEQGREVFAIPGSIHSAQTKGCHALIKAGAKLVEKTEDILEELKGIVSFKTNSSLQQKDLFQSREKELDKELDKLLNYVGYDCISVDQLVFQMNHTSDLICAMLTELELKGYVVSVPGGYMRTRVPA